VNIFENIKTPLEAEEFSELLSSDNLTIERIVSLGHQSPQDFWYDQAQHEWVLVLSGQGIVEFEDGRNITLNRGDYLNIPAHQKHRVKATAPNEVTIWLAVHYLT
jgi:cupin 2 domain-containing protein